MNKIILYLIFLAPLFGCPIDEKGKGHNKVILVFCDITKSLNSEGVNKVIDNASKILKSNRYAEIYFFPVDSTTSNPLLEKGSWENLGINDVENNESIMVDSLKKVIDERYRTGNARATCLLKCFDAANEVFKREDSVTKSFYIYFLSDMLEHCEYGGKLVSLEKKEKVKPATTWMKDTWSPNVNFKEKGVKIAFILTPTHQIPIDEQDRKNFWREACLKYGYASSDFETFPFSPIVPNEY